jgi:hypothetical protein
MPVILTGWIRSKSLVDVNHLYFDNCSEITFLDFKLIGTTPFAAPAAPPAPPTVADIATDDAYAEWYEHTFGKVLNCSQVLPVLHALQGHPKSGHLWEVHIGKILWELKFATTIHDHSIYCAIIGGKPILLLCQVDDFAMACPNEEVAHSIYGQIGKSSNYPPNWSHPSSTLVSSMTSMVLMCTNIVIVSLSPAHPTLTMSLRPMDGWPPLQKVMNATPAHCH